jgi:hypothetical protein
VAVTAAEMAMAETKRLKRRVCMLLPPVDILEYGSRVIL